MNDRLQDTVEIAEWMGWTHETDFCLAISNAALKVAKEVK